LFFYPLLGSLVLVHYTLLSLISPVKSLDYVTNGIEHYTSLHIISAKSEEIKFLISNKFRKGITKANGVLPDSFDEKQDCDIIVTIVTRLELLRIKEKITEIDSEAFMYIQYIKTLVVEFFVKVKH
jgi:uncharacterized membrane-anchored protein YitT (DUF2179 family)